MVMSTAQSPSSPAPRRRRWLQYRLRTLLGLMLLVALGMSYLSVTIREARRQYEVAKVLQKKATVVTQPIWLAKVFGDDSLVEVTSICVDTPSWITDAWLVQVKDLRQLRSSGPSPLGRDGRWAGASEWVEPAPESEP